MEKELEKFFYYAGRKLSDLNKPPEDELQKNRRKQRQKKDKSKNPKKQKKKKMQLTMILRSVMSRRKVQMTNQRIPWKTKLNQEHKRNERQMENTIILRWRV